MYTGVTSDIMGRIWEHKTKAYPNSFTAKYNCNKLVYYAFYSRIEEAIAVEKSIKGSNKAYKQGLINALIRNGLICMIR